MIAREDVAGENRLVAYYKLSDASTDAESVCTFLAGSLAEYMMPEAFVRLDRFPLTSSGKLDRKALPCPSPAAPASATTRT